MKTFAFITATILMSFLNTNSVAQNPGSVKGFVVNADKNPELLMH